MNPKHFKGSVPSENEVSGKRKYRKSSPQNSRRIKSPFGKIGLLFTLSRKRKASLKARRKSSGLTHKKRIKKQKKPSFSLRSIKFARYAKAAMLLFCLLAASVGAVYGLSLVDRNIRTVINNPQPPVFAVDSSSERYALSVFGKEYSIAKSDAAQTAKSVALGAAVPPWFYFASLGVSYGVPFIYDLMEVLVKELPVIFEKIL